MGLFSNFFGGESRDDLKAANRRANASIAKAGTEYDTNYATARSDIAPYTQSGQQANETYNALLGLRGDAARSQAQGTYLSDPIFDQLATQQDNALFRKYNAAGVGNSGASRLALGRAGLERYGSYMDRLAGLGQGGQQNAQFAAGLATQQGANKAGLQLTKAGNQINFGNALAENRNTGINNLMGVAGLALKATGWGGFGK